MPGTRWAQGTRWAPAGPWALRANEPYLPARVLAAEHYLARPALFHEDPVSFRDQAGGRGHGSPGWWWLRQQTTEKEIRLWDFV